MPIKEAEPIKFEAWKLDLTGKPIGRELQTIPVESLSNMNMAAMPLAERVGVLDRLAVPQSLTELTQLFTRPLSTVKPDTLHIAATVQQYKMFTWENDYWQNKQDRKKQEFKDEVQAIRSGKQGGGKGNQNRLIGKAESILRGEFEKNEPQKKAASELKDTVLDGFIHDVFLTKNGVVSLLSETEELTAQSRVTRADVADLVRIAGERLQKLKSPDHARYFQYKDGSNNFTRKEDLDVLKQITESAFGDVAQGNVLSIQLQQTARDLISFYFKNVDVLYGNEEKTPHLALIIDIIETALGRFDLSKTENAVRYAWSQIAQDPAKFKNNLLRSVQIGSTNIQKMLDELTRDRDQLKPTFTLSDFLASADHSYLQKWDPLVRKCMFDTHYDRLLVFAEISRNIAGKVFNLRDYNSEWIDPRDRMVQKMHTPEFRYLFITFENVLFGAFPDYEQSSIYSRSTFTTRDEHIRIRTSALYDVTHYLPNTRQGYQDHIDRVSNSIELSATHLRDGSFTAIVLSSTFSGLGEENIEGMLKRLKENKALMREVFDHDIWFVATNGDQYHTKKNPELGENHIRALTYYPDPQTGGYRVEMISEFVNKNKQPYKATFYITGEGEFLVGSRTRDIIELPYWISLPMEHFVVERLYFITSGKLKEHEDKEHKDNGTEQKDRSVEEVRRGHWRSLFSTPQRVYTLLSRTAVIHADYVKKEYGKDIYKENLRRKANGDLKDNEVITFVKPTITEKTEPNQITFDQSLIE